MRSYVPPPVPLPRARPPGVLPRDVHRHDRPRRSAVRPLLGTLLVLAAAGLVVVFVILPLLDLGAGGGSPGQSPSATAAPSAPAGTVLIPSTVGMSTAEAIDVATEAGLDWTVRCDEDPAQPEGIIHQEPPADTAVSPRQQIHDVFGAHRRLPVRDLYSAGPTQFHEGVD